MKKLLKKAISIFVSVMLLASVFNVAFADETTNTIETEEPTQEAEGIKGDVDGDGIISINDVTYLQKYLASVLSDEEKEFCDFSNVDMNNNGVVDINDATFIQIYISNGTINPTEPTEETTEEATDPVETTEEATDPVETTEETTEPVETTEEATDPVETTEEATDPVETTEEATDPVETTEEATDPVETTEEATDPVETTEEATDPVETTEEATDPVETTEEATDPVETTEEPTEPTEKPTEPDDTKNDYYILPESNTRLLEVSDIENLSYAELELARNEIYARHGRLFDTDYIQEYFNGMSWYNGTIAPEDFDYSVISEIELANVWFIYDYEHREYILPESDNRLLTISDIEDLSPRELELARNEIYARHGRLFDTDYIQEYFNSKGWYKGTIAPEDFDYTVINDIELANAWFIYDYEHAMYGNITEEKLLAIN